jgi:hypothetical protein
VGQPNDLPDGNKAKIITSGYKIAIVSPVSNTNEQNRCFFDAKVAFTKFFRQKFLLCPLLRILGPEARIAQVLVKLVMPCNFTTRLNLTYCGAIDVSFVNDLQQAVSLVELRAFDDS